MSSRRIPAVFDVRQGSAFNIPNMPTIVAYAGHPITYEITYEQGAPPITDAQLRTAKLELYTDAERNNRLGEDDESDYSYTIEPGENNTFELTLNLANVSISSNTMLYAVFVFEQD